MTQWPGSGWWRLCGKGRELVQHGQFTRVVPNEVALPTLETT